MRNVIPVQRPLNRILAALRTSRALLDSLNRNVKEDIVHGIHVYGCAIRGKGEMTGKEFANCCRMVWTDKNPANAHFYKLFEDYVISINVTYGQIHVKYRVE